MNDKIINSFIISHLKKAIWNLECANNLKPNTIDIVTIIELKNILEKVSQK